MFRKPVMMAVFVLPLINPSSAWAEEIGTSFQDEIRLSCEKYAVEDQVLPEKVKAYVESCVRDFNKPQPLDASLMLGLEEGIGEMPPIDEHPPSEEDNNVEDERP